MDSDWVVLSQITYACCALMHLKWRSQLLTAKIITICFVPIDLKMNTSLYRVCPRFTWCEITPPSVSRMFFFPLLPFSQVWKILVVPHPLPRWWPLRCPLFLIQLSSVLILTHLYFLCHEFCCNGRYMDKVTHLDKVFLITVSLFEQ